MLRSLFECSYKSRSAVLCVDASSNFMVLTYHHDDVIDTYVGEDLLLALGAASSFLMEGLKVEEIERFYNDAQPIKGLVGKLETTEKASESFVLLRFTSRGKLLFQKTFEDITDAQMMEESYRAALSGWQLVKTTRKVSAQAAVILMRQNPTHQARLLRLLPGSEDEAEGLVLEIVKDGVPLLSRFGLFSRAIGQGNAFVPPGKEVIYRRREGIQYFGPQLELDIVSNQETCAPSHTAALFEYTLNNVKTAVVPISKGQMVGFQIEVYVDDAYISTLLMDMGRGNHPFPLPRAIREAQDLLNLLQGWHTD